MSDQPIKPVRKAVFPVAGLGTRYLPATKVMPKEMLPLVDRPLIQRAVEEAQQAGIEEFIFVAGRNKTMITEHFEFQPELQEALRQKGKDDLLAKVESTDIPSGNLLTCIQQKALGLGHAVWCARKLIGDEPFVLSLVDVVTLSDVPCLTQMMNSYRDVGGNIVASVPVAPELTYKYGILDVEDEGADVTPIKTMVEKPNPAQAPSNLSILGRYILQPEIFDILGAQSAGAGGEIQLTDAMLELSRSQDFTSVKLDGQSFDCGHHVGFIEANIAFALNDPDFGPDMQKIIKKYAS